MQDHEKIRAARKAADMTVEQLAVKAGLAGSTVRAAERGEGSPGTILLLWQALGMLRVEGGDE